MVQSPAETSTTATCKSAGWPTVPLGNRMEVAKRPSGERGGNESTVSDSTSRSSPVPSVWIRACWA